jgi:dipeptidase E
MICFLSSRIDDAETGELYTSNHLIDEFRRCFPKPCKALFVCSDPDACERTDFYALLTKGYFENAGFQFTRFCILDGRNWQQATEYVRDSNLIILAGGHVPTQNRFFQEICLRELMKDYNGVVVGISAGSMNSADEVYAQPEEEGEATDPAYQRFLPGLNLTKTRLLPHY